MSKTYTVCAVHFLVHKRECWSICISTGVDKMGDTCTHRIKNFFFIENIVFKYNM